MTVSGLMRYSAAKVRTDGREPCPGAERLLGKPNMLINANEEMWAFFKNFHR